MTRRLAVVSVASAVLFAFVGDPGASPVEAHGKKRSFAAVLSGFNEVPSVSTGAWGFFRARLSRDGDSLHYELSYRGLSAGVRFAHIHLGQSRTNGGIIVFLCQTPGFVDPTGLSPDCPQEGSVRGTVTSDNVIGPAGQGIAAGELNEMIRAIRSGATYVNVHSDAFPGGELRGQVR